MRRLPGSVAALPEVLPPPAVFNGAFGGPGVAAEVITDWRNELKGGLLRPVVITPEAPTWQVDRGVNHSAVEFLRSELDALRDQLRRTASDCARRCEAVEAGYAQRLAGLQEADILRSELEAVRDQLRRSSADCARRCGEVESACAQRVTAAQEASMLAARNLWEEHQGVVVECKSALASLKSMIEAKDRLAAQQQQREEEKQASQRQARFSEGERAADLLRSELDALREQLRRMGADCARRCEEAEAVCAQRVASVQEAALSAARDLWEEHQGVVVECKTSLASLRQILEAKDKIAAQLQSLLQQRDDDKQELFARLQEGHQALLRRAAELEGALAMEQTSRVESQQAADVYAGRIALALEKAQASWVKEAERLGLEMRTMQQQVGQSIDGEARGFERRLAEAVDAVQRRVDDLESRATTSKASITALGDRLAESARAQEADVRDTEARLKRAIADLQAIQAGRFAQCDFDLRAALRAALTEHSERIKTELAQLEQATASECATVRAAAQELGKEAGERVGKLREEVERHLTTSEEVATRRQTQTADALSQVRADLTEYHRQARLHADRTAQEAKASLEAASKEVKEELDRQAQRGERAIVEVTRLCGALEERLAQGLAASEGRCASRLSEALSAEREKAREEVRGLLEEERNARLQAEAERMGALHRRLGALEDASGRRHNDLQGQVDLLRGRVEEAGAALQEKLRHAEDAAAQAIALEAERAGRAADELRGRLQVVEQEGKDLRELQEQRFREQGKVNREAETRQDAAADDIGLLGRKLQEMSAQSEAYREADLAEVQRQLEKVGQACDQKTSQLEEQLATVTQAAAKEVADRLGRLREELEQRLAASEEASSRQKTQTADALSQLQGAVDDAARDAARVAQEAKAAVEAAAGELREELGQQAQRSERALADMAADHEARLSTGLAAALAEAKSTRALAEAEGDRVGALERQVASHEEVTSRRLEALEGQVLASQTREEGARQEIASEREKEREELQSRMEADAEKLAALEGRLAAQEAAASQRLVAVEGRLDAQEAAAAQRLSAVEGRLDAQEAAAARGLGDLEQRLSAQEESARQRADDVAAQLVDLAWQQQRGEEAAQERQGRALEELAGRVRAAEEALTALQRAQEQRSEEEAKVVQEVEQLRARQEEAQTALQAQLQLAEESSAKVPTEDAERQGKLLDELQNRLAAAEQDLRALREEHEKGGRDCSDLGREVEQLRLRLEEAVQTIQSEEADILSAAVQRECENGEIDDLRARLHRVEEVLEERRAAEEKGSQETAAQVEAARKQQEEAQAALHGKLQELQESAAKAASEERERQGGALEELRGRLLQTEKDAQELRELQERVAKSASEGKEEHGAALEELRGRILQAEQDTKELRELQEQRQREQFRVNTEVEARQNAAVDDITLLGQKLQDLAAMSEAASPAEDMQKQLEEMAAELMSKVDACAPKEAVIRLAARLDGSLDALAVRLETDRWVRDNVDKVADTVANQFLHLLEDSSKKLEARVGKCEALLSAAAK